MSDLADRVPVYELAALASTRGEPRRRYAASALLTWSRAPLWASLLVVEALCDELPAGDATAADEELFAALVRPAIARGLP